MLGVRRGVCVVAGGISCNGGEKSLCVHAQTPLVNLRAMCHRSLQAA